MSSWNVELAEHSARHSKIENVQLVCWASTTFRRYLKMANVQLEHWANRTFYATFNIAVRHSSFFNVAQIDLLAQRSSSTFNCFQCRAECYISSTFLCDIQKRRMLEHSARHWIKANVEVESGDTQKRQMSRCKVKLAQHLVWHWKMANVELVCWASRTFRRHSKMENIELVCWASKTFRRHSKMANVEVEC